MYNKNRLYTFFQMTSLAIFPKEESSVYAFVEISIIKIRHNAIT